MSAPRPRSRRRTILKVIALLAAGAALNVAVAWGIVYADADRVVRYIWDTGFTARVWPRGMPISWPAPASYWDEESAFGIHIWSGNKWVEKSGAGDIFEHFHASRIDVGWPSYALHSLWYEHGKSGGEVVNESPNWMRGINRSEPFGGTERLPFPFVPTWPGFAINTVFYAGVLWMLFCGPFALRRLIRRRHGQCPACAYPVGTSEVCTECGTRHAVIHEIVQPRGNASRSV